MLMLRMSSYIQALVVGMTFKLSLTVSILGVLIVVLGSLFHWLMVWYGGERIFVIIVFIGH